MAEALVEALQMLEDVDLLGFYEPPTMNVFAQLPGALGGANWQGAAFDPETQYLYVPSVHVPTLLRLIPAAPGTSDYRYRHEVLTTRWLGPQGLPYTKPPYGRVTAYDLNSGEIVWVSPLGEGPRDHPALRGLALPRLGWPQRGAPLLTRSLLFVGQEARNWLRLGAFLGGEISEPERAELTVFHPALHVYDKATGDLITEIALPASVITSPAGEILRMVWLEVSAT